MDTRFIGRDGFGEIESIFDTKKKTSAKSVKKLNTAQKTLRFVKRATRLCAKRFTRKLNTTIKRKAQTKPIGIENRRSSSDEFNSSAKEALTSVVSVNNRRYAHGEPRKSSLKKKAILATVASLTAVSMTFATGVGALDIPSVTPHDSKADAVLSTDSTVVIGENMDKLNPEIVITKDIFGLYIDGELIGVTEDGEGLSSALDKILLDYRAGYDDATTTEFANSVEVKKIEATDIEPESVDELIAQSENKFSIALSTDMPYTTAIEHETVYEYDDNESTSYKKVKKEGKDGKIEVVVRTTFTDGVQTDAYVSETNVLEEAVDEVIVKGTIESGTATGSFIWPLPYTHCITSEYDWRWGRMHNGIDIADSGVYGEPAVAADGGVVTQAGDDGGGYGIYVIVDHGNGYSTLYGHFSGLAVSVGDYVSQGQTVGYVGSTGNSTGPHLHFEVMVNGEKTNPLNYF